MQKIRPYVLCIGGFDPSGGAGILADIKALEQLKVVGLAVLTCNTVQTEDEFFKLDWLCTADVLCAIQKIMQRYPIYVVKIGVVQNTAMLHSIVTEVMLNNPKCKIVWDTVFGSTSGVDLFDFGSVEKLEDVFPSLYLMTPNVMEYDRLADLDLINRARRAKVSVLKKGGHNKTQVGIDVLYVNQSEIEIHSEFIKLPQKHGSGCVLASTIAGYLGLGNDLVTSCQLAKHYITQFLKSNNTLLGYHYE